MLLVPRPQLHSPNLLLERALSADSESRVPRQLPTGLLPQGAQFYRSKRWPEALLSQARLQ
jgi:hypothetical protein